jgi:hypothetical protein
LKHESGESDIIVYDMHDDYSLGRSSKPKKTTDKEEKKETPVSSQRYDNSEPMALLGGFSGRVYDKLTYRTIEGALVTIAKDLSIKTDEKGIFVATGIKPGKYRIMVFEEGYMAQSCKGTAIAGGTTKLDSFHLIPDCLVAEYPDNIVKEEEETAEEEFVEFAMEAPQSILSEEITHAREAEDIRKEETETQVAAPDELYEQTAQLSPDSAVFEDTHGATAPDIEIRKGTTEEKTIEHHKKQSITEDFTPLKDIGDEVFPAFDEVAEAAVDAYIDIVAAAFEEKKEISPDEVIAVLLEQIETVTAEDAAEAAISALEEKETLTDEPFIPEIFLALVETVIAEVKQPEETLEKVQKETPQEITIEEAPIELAAEVMIQEEVGEVGPQEKHIELSTGEVVEETASPLEQQGQPFAHPSEVIPQIAVEEVTQPEETPQAPAGEKSRLGKLWKTLRNKIAKELELSQEESTELSAGEVAEETASPLEQQEQPLEPPEKTASEIEARKIVSEKPLEDAQPIAASFEEIQVSATFKESTETVMSAPEKIVVESVSSVDELPRMSIETGTAETTQLEEVPQELSGEETPVEEISMETVVEETVQEKTKEEIPQEELLGPPIEIAPEISVQEEIAEEICEKELLEPSVEVSPELAAQEEGLEEVHLEEPSIDVSLKEIPTLAMLTDSTEAIMSEPEKIIVGDIFFVDQFPHMFVESDIAETTQPKEALLEIPGEESPIETAAEEIAQKEIEEDAYLEHPSEPSVEAAPEIIAWEEIIEEVHRKESLEPPINIFLDLTAQEEITEVTQPEKVRHVVPDEVPQAVSQEVSEERSGSKLVWWTRRKKKTKQTDQEQFSGPSMELSSKIAPQEKALMETGQKRPSVEETVVECISSVDELSRMSIETDAAEATQPEEVPRELSGEETLAEEVSIETVVEKNTQKKIKDGLHRKKLSGDASFEKAVEAPAVDESTEKIITAPDNWEVAADITSTVGSVTREEALEDISDDDLASMSDEEKKAMSHGHDSVEVEGFIGIINAQPNPAYKGLPVSIAYTLRNIACDNPDDFILQIIVIDPNTGAIYETFETPVVCNKNTFSMGGFVIFTTTYETHFYRLNMQIVSKKAKVSHLLVDIPLEIKSIY